jgi:hypothetical protein
MENKYILSIIHPDKLKKPYNKTNNPINKRNVDNTEIINDLVNEIINDIIIDKTNNESIFSLTECKNSSNNSTPFKYLCSVYTTADVSLNLYDKSSTFYY